MASKSFAAKLEGYLGKKSKTTLLLAALVLNFLVGYADHITGYEISVSFFYLLPLLLAVWFIGRGAGIIMSVLCVSTIAVSNSLAGEQYYRNMNAMLWNLALIECFFLVVVFLSSQIKSDMREREELIEKLQNALASVKTLTGLLPMCASCKKIRDDQGYWTQVDRYISEHTDADFTHGLCPECVKKLYPEHYENIFNKKKERCRVALISGPRSRTPKY